MTKPRIMIVLIIVAFLLVITGWVMGFLAFSEYSKKVAYIDEKITYFDGYNKFLSKKFKGLEQNLGKVKFDLDMVASSSVTGRKELIAQIDSLKHNLQNWQNDYVTSFSKFQEDYLRRVNLGEISVGKKK